MQVRAPHTHREVELIEALRRLGGSARSADLAKALDVSEETVRRTIKSLSKSGEVARVHGGAYLVGNKNDPSFFRRISQNAAEKRVIAAGVVDQIHDGMCLFLDVGSTTAFVAEKLSRRSNLTVATNSIGVAQTLVSQNDNRVHLLGGEMQSDERGAFGYVTEKQARRFSFDMAVLSADALSPKRGFLYLNAAEADLGGIIAENADRVLMAMTHHKFNEKAPHIGLKPSQVDDMVTDQTPDPTLAQALADWDITTLLADGKTRNADTV
ncbi:DeoR/GlpR family DNA-binding transcription regulator [Aliisedimentitalea scapharcae]|uniref:DeoR/GlpR family DNA-binding transcription regulator n=1 Tax=Aliisedimentitalea scapharcae TaxID=1524259 RepID=A0ABZ2XVB1_9RHOB